MTKATSNVVPIRRLAAGPHATEALLDFGPLPDTHQLTRRAFMEAAEAEAVVLVSEVLEAQEPLSAASGAIVAPDAAEAWRWLAQFRAAGGVVTCDRCTGHVAIGCPMDACERAWELYADAPPEPVRTEVRRLVRAEAASRTVVRF